MASTSVHRLIYASPPRTSILRHKSYIERNHDFHLPLTLFFKKVSDIELMKGEILISFDACSLFPSVPIAQTLEYPRDLWQQNSLSRELINKFLSLTSLCRKPNYFQIEKRFVWTKIINGNEKRFVWTKIVNGNGKPLIPFISQFVHEKIWAGVVQNI